MLILLLSIIYCECSSGSDSDVTTFTFVRAPLKPLYCSLSLVSLWEPKSRVKQLHGDFKYCYKAVDEKDDCILSNEHALIRDEYKVSGMHSSFTESSVTGTYVFLLDTTRIVRKSAPIWKNW